MTMLQDIAQREKDRWDRLVREFGQEAVEHAYQQAQKLPGSNLDEAERSLRDQKRRLDFYADCDQIQRTRDMAHRIATEQDFGVLQGLYRRGKR